jgi:prepilin-type N-terminal cleavage/methylation domain-containing protein
MQNANLTQVSRAFREAGFTLVELLIALLVFGTISAAAFSLAAQNAPIFNQQQNQAGLNIAMRNAVAQIQADMVNGGAGYYNGLNVPNWPVSVVITNQVVSSSGNCATGTTYGTSCFDSFVVISADPNTTAVNPLASSLAGLPPGPSTCSSVTVNTSTSNDIFVLPPSSGGFQVYDQVLLVKSDASAYTTVRLTAVTPVTVSGTAYVKLSHSSFTNANGTNASADDATNMSVTSPDQTTAQFCNTDFVVRLIPVEYCVDTATDSTDPTLRRIQLVNQPTTPACSTGTGLANQIIGFKVGATVTQSKNGNDLYVYNFDSSTYGAPLGSGFDYTQIHSVMVSMIGRTTPDPTASYTFRNSFDGGPYQIQGVSVVVNPRNMNF